MMRKFFLRNVRFLSPPKEVRVHNLAGIIKAFPRPISEPIVGDDSELCRRKAADYTPEKHPYAYTNTDDSNPFEAKKLKAVLWTAFSISFTTVLAEILINRPSLCPKSHPCACG